MARGETTPTSVRRPLGTRFAAGLYALSLRAYPAAFRRDVGAQMIETFRDRWHGAGRRGALSPWAVLLGGILDSLNNGLGERLHPGRGNRLPSDSPRSPRRRFIMGSIFDDLKRAARRLQRAPIFTASVVLTIGVGVGAFVSIYSTIDNVLWEDMPYEDPDRLAYLWRNYTWADFPRGWAGGIDVLAIRENVDSIEGVTALRNGSVNLSSRDGGEPQEIRVTLTSANFFDLLGVPPAMGRGFRAGEDIEGANLVVVLGRDLWQQRYGADPEIIGRAIYMDGEAAEVIGVLGEDFHFTMHASLSAPANADAYVNMRWNLAEVEGGSFAALARVREGVSAEALQAELDAVIEPIDREYFDSLGLRVWPAFMREDLVKDVRPALIAIGAAAAFMLLILCVNLATLLLGRATRRSSELAVSAALGASRWALLRDCMSESLLLTFSGSALGLLLARWGTTLIADVAVDLPRRYAIGIDASVAVAALVTATLLGIAAGIAPAWRAARTDMARALREAGGRATSSRAPGAMVVAQVAISLVLLVGAGVLARSFVYLMRSDPGFDPDGVLTVRLPVTPDLYPEAVDLMNLFVGIRDGIAALPGVEAVGGVNALPLTQETAQTSAAFPSSPLNSGVEQEDTLLVDWFTVIPGYFDAMGVAVLAGRDFRGADDAEAPRVAIIDDTLAERFFPGQDVVGQTMMFRGIPHQVVGIIDQPRLYDIHQDDRSQVFVPLAQEPGYGTSLAIRTRRDPVALVPEIQRLVHGIDPDQPLSDFRSMRQVVAESLNGERLSLGLIAGFAAGALLLATLGLYGVVSNAVSSRTREMGLRMALGADGARVRSMVVGQGMRLALIGSVVGIAGSLATARFLESLLVGVAPADPLTLVAACLGMALVTLIACYVPARRASSVDPLVALRRD